MSKMERVVFPLEGVKFLSLNNRSHLEGNLNPRKLGFVDSVLRDLEVERLMKEQHKTTVIIEEEVADIIDVATVELIPPVYPIKNVIVAKIPFLASIQYECLEDSADIIYKLIKSVQNSHKNKENIARYEYKEPVLNPLQSLEISQAQKLEEITKWRLELMGKVSQYNKTQLNEVHKTIDSNAIMN